MRRRPTASGKSAKPRSPTTKAKRRNKPNASTAREENEVARLTRELDDALERQAATSEVLSMVSSPSGELDLIFRAILTQCDCTAFIETNNMERVLADIDADCGNRSAEILRHGVLLVFGAPCQHRSLAGQEHGRTIP
jgi:hypothetical protein